MTRTTPVQMVNSGKQRNPTVLSKVRMVNCGECEETEETRKATQKLHEDIRKLERKAPDYGVGK